MTNIAGQFLTVQISFALLNLIALISARVKNTKAQKSQGQEHKPNATEYQAILLKNKAIKNELPGLKLFAYGCA